MLEEKLAQVFQVLAPEKFGSIGAVAEPKEAMNEQTGSYLRAGVIVSAGKRVPMVRACGRSAHDTITRPAKTRLTAIWNA